MYIQSTCHSLFTGAGMCGISLSIQLLYRRNNAVLHDFILSPIAQIRLLDAGLFGERIYHVYGSSFFFTLMTALFIDLDFPPNGAENYKHVLIGDFFPSEIPETAYDVQVYSISGFGQGWNEAYLSYRDAPEHIAPYAEMARERAQKQSRSPYINEGIRVPKITVDETCIDPRFLEDPWARFFLDYVPHPVKIESLDEPFVFYIWDTNESWNHPKGSIVGVSEDGTHIIFYLVGP